jgi:hypothetical protein
MTEPKKSKVKNKAVQDKTVAEFFSWQVDLCGKTQKQIAEEAGFQKPNIITMFKKGDTKLPLEKIGRIAKAIEVDPIHLMCMCLREYMPETFWEIEKMFGQPVLTANELEILEIVRRSNVVNPRVRTDQERAAILNAVNSLKPDNAVND